MSFFDEVSVDELIEELENTPKDELIEKMKKAGFFDNNRESNDCESE